MKAEEAVMAQAVPAVVAAREWRLDRRKARIGRRASTLRCG
jgi:hypothetical protein